MKKPAREKLSAGFLLGDWRPAIAVVPSSIKRRTSREGYVTPGRLDQRVPMALFA